MIITICGEVEMERWLKCTVQVGFITAVTLSTDASYYRSSFSW